MIAKHFTLERLVSLQNLYSHTPSERAFAHLRALAERHPRTKFVSIVGDKCIPNYPDKHLPTFFNYRKGEVINQQIAWGADRERSLEGLYIRHLHAPRD